MAKASAVKVWPMAAKQRVKDPAAATKRKVKASAVARKPKVKASAAKVNVVAISRVPQMISEPISSNAVRVSEHHG